MYLFLLLSSFFFCQAVEAELEIIGTPREISQNIQKRIDYKMRFPQELDERFLDQVRRETIEAIKPYGYFSPQVIVSEDPSDQHVLINVSLNRISHIRSIEIEYTKLPENMDLEALIATVSQQYIYSPFSNKTMNEISSAIKEKATNLGYNDVVITRGYTSVNKQAHLADITYLVTLNDKNIFGHITYPESTKKYCFNRFHNIHEGEHYSNEKLRDFQKNLMGSGLYSKSTVKTVPRKNAPHIQDVIVEYTPIKPVQLFLGLGGSANIGEAQILPQAQAQANIDMNNLGGCGNTINLGIKGSASGGRFHISALFPQHTGIQDFMLVSAKINNTYYSDDDSSQFFKTSALLQKYFDPFVHQLSLNCLIENSKLNNDTTSYLTQLIFPKYRILTKVKGERSDLLFKIKAICGASSLFSDINFIQIDSTALLRARYKKFQVSTQLSYGKIFAPDFSEYPLSMQYYLGGPSSNRGLSDREINEGKTYLLSRNQVLLNIKGPFFIGGFFDTGYCTNPNRSINYYPAFGLLGSAVTGYGNFELSIGRLVDDTKWVILLNIVPGADIL